MLAALAPAQAALDRGDYGQCLALLKPLSDENPTHTKDGSEIRMLMVTAFMGIGDNEKALSTCRLITNSKDPELRQVAKQLITILEAPALERPAKWSIKMPTIEFNSLENSSFNKVGKSLKQTKSPKLPPTGPTKGLDIGFSIFVITILAGLTFLLSGCIRINTEIQLPSPDKVDLSWEIESSTQKLLPWQSQFQESLKNIIPKLSIYSNKEGRQKIKAQTLTSKEANLLLQQIVMQAANTAGIEIISPELKLSKQNWLIGFKQNLKLSIDLTTLPEVPGLRLSVTINPSGSSKHIKASPLIPIQNGTELIWPIKQGDLNVLTLHKWYWSSLGIGTLLIIILLIFFTNLQKIRLRMGFGFPELPP